MDRRFLKEVHLGEVAVLSLAAALLILATGCATVTGGRSGAGGNPRLDLLTAYAAALSKRDFEAAVRYLTPEDQLLIRDSVGEIRGETKERLRALELTILYKHPAIKVSNGKISGIHALLPVLDQGPAQSRDSLIAAYVPAVSPDASRRADARLRKQELKAAVDAFFQSVRARKWEQALESVHPEERKVFLRENGEFRKGTRKRLAAADSADWDALTLRDGKLTGVVVILPPLSSVRDGDSKR